MARTKSIKSDESLQEAMQSPAEAAQDAVGSPGRLLMNVKTGAQAAVSQIGPSVSGGIKVIAYRGIYSVAYGVTFGLLMAEKLIPVRGFVAEAIQDGNSAARQAFLARNAEDAVQTRDASVLSA